MKAHVVNCLGAGFELDDVQIAAPMGRAVLGDVRASGLSHTDLLFDTQDIVPIPAILGHELAVVVTEVRPDAVKLIGLSQGLESVASPSGHLSRGIN